MRRFVVLALIGCGGEATEVGLPDPATFPTPLPTEPQEDPEVAGITDAHNVVREGVGIGPLTWDPVLAEFAAEHIAFLDSERSCNLIHSIDPPYGENLFWASFPVDSGIVVQSWADEVLDYDYPTNRCNPGKACGHYTQIVWEDTERVGCAKIVCGGGRGEIWSCNYDPPGNWVGEHPY